MIEVINEVLQWIAIGTLAYPKVRQFVQDFMEEDEYE